MSCCKQTLAAALIAFALFVPHLFSEDIYSHPLTDANRASFTSICGALSVHAVQRGSFTQTKHIARLNRNLVSEGAFVIASSPAGSTAGGIVWQTQKPFASTMAITERGIVQTSASGYKTTVDAGSNATFKELSAVISAVFRGDAAVLAEHFTVYFSENGADAAGSRSWQMALVPTDSTLQHMIQSIEMYGVVSDAMSPQARISAITMQETNGDSIAYAFSNQQFSDSLTAAEKALFD